MYAIKLSKWSPISGRQAGVYVESYQPSLGGTDFPDSRERSFWKVNNPTAVPHIFTTLRREIKACTSPPGPSS
jgi:hypothetical protein